MHTHVANLQGQSSAGDVEVGISHKLADGLDKLLEQATLGKTCFEHCVRKVCSVLRLSSGRDPALPDSRAGFLLTAKS